MANSKISALTSATTPLAGTETLPVVQSSTTKKVTVANLTAGRAVSVLSINQAGTSAGLQSYFGFTSGLNYIGVGYNGVTYSTQIGFDVTSEFGHIQPIRGAGVYGNLKLCPNGGDVLMGNNLVPSTAAKGVNFTANTPASGMTSQLLNWYEEGTWTPVLRFGGGTTGITYTTQQGRYTRVGRTVTIRFEITLSSKGSSTGEADITGLPFAAANLNAMSVYLYSNFLLTYKVGIAYCNGSTINEIAANGTAAFTDVQFTNTSRFWATCTYQV